MLEMLYICILIKDAMETIRLEFNSNIKANILEYIAKDQPFFARKLKSDLLRNIKKN